MFRRLASRMLLIAFLSLPAVAQANDDGGPYVTSVVQLITQAAEFEGRKVRAFGYLAEAPTLQLFLTDDHAAAGDVLSAIAVSDDAAGSLRFSNCFDQYVYLTGTVRASSPYTYRIAQVTRVSPVAETACSFTIRDDKRAL